MANDKIIYEIQDPENTVIIEKANLYSCSGFVLTKFKGYDDNSGYNITKQPIEYNEHCPGPEDWDAVVRMLWALIDMLDILSNLTFQRQKFILEI